jgi:hypothetical protein
VRPLQAAPPPPPNLVTGFWLEVSLHPEGPATGQIEQGFTCVYSVVEQLLQLVRKLHFTRSGTTQVLVRAA